MQAKSAIFCGIVAQVGDCDDRHDRRHAQAALDAPQPRGDRCGLSHESFEVKRSCNPLLIKIGALLFVHTETAAPVIVCAAGKGPLDEVDFQFAGVVRSNCVRTMEDSTGPLTDEFFTVCL